MNKKSLEIIIVLGSVVIFIVLITAAKLAMPAKSGYGYSIALLIFVIIMGMAGLKLAEIPDK
ncbi:MAG: hypothetical protein Q8O41_03680 [Candidatus Methanoperedens sp.]|nr:hypothetical protein [Candidatus Methanoperedens sp.]